MPDDGTIDITHMTEEDRREHYRRINQLTTCPCYMCTAVCDQWRHVAECEPYQAWLEYNEPRRGRRKYEKR